MKFNFLPVLIRITLTLCVFVLFSLSDEPRSAAQEPSLDPAAPPPPPANIIPGEIIVKFQPSVGLLGAQNSLRAEGIRPLEVAPSADLVRVQVEPGREAETIADLIARGDVEFATFNYRVQALVEPSDPYFNWQTSLKQADDHDIDAPEAWTLHTGGPEVVIAVIDTGVDLDHPDLIDKITAGSEAGYNFINPSSPPDDDNGHGTHVAGIAAASSNNNRGVAGVSWGARIMPLKVLNSAGSGDTYNVAVAIRYAADHGADIINMSLGGGCGVSGWPDVEDALRYAFGKGLIIVAASGNTSSAEVYCPAAMDEVVAVGATDTSDIRASFSNYGSELDVMAPGTSVISTIRGGYGYMSGTSMSTPHVTGVAALMRSFGPGLTNLQVMDFIESTADDLGAMGWDQYYGYGRVNARHALDMVALHPAQTPNTFLFQGDVTSIPQRVQILTSINETISWSAAIAPKTSWLSLLPPGSGNISLTSASQFIELTASRPANYGAYTTYLILSGVTASGKTVGPISIPIHLEYRQSEDRTLFLPLIVR